MFSAGLHGLLLVILVASSAFSGKPVEKDMPIMTMLPANIVDRAGAGGGGPAPAPPEPKPAPVQPIVQQPQPTPPQPAPKAIVQPAPTPAPRPIAREPVPQPVVREPSPLPAPKPVKTHPKPEKEIVPSFETVKQISHRKTPAENEAEAAADARAKANAAARAERNRLRAIERGLGDIAANVKNTGAPNSVVDTAGVGGGAAFVGYEVAIFNAYYRAWSTPDSVASRTANVDVKIVVARDGTVLSAEVVRKSGDRSLDNSVERALKEVRSLPPFPPASTDQQRSFTIRFNLEAKEGSG
jgi:TonB family protein